jgi:hypothetical protein
MMILMEEHTGEKRHSSKRYQQRFSGDNKKNQGL